MPLRNRATTVLHAELMAHPARRSLAVRGAPAIGIFGAYGVALAAQLHADAAFDAAVQRIRSARPTAVNLAYAVDRVLARADRDYLASRGIDARRIQTISYGKDRPVDPSSSPDAWAHNRNAITSVR